VESRRGYILSNPPPLNDSADAHSLGDSFSVGDVLLEIETDKAQMDVEAQDDGVMARIVVAAGTKGVAVGTRIAVLAEQGDDLATLEMPKDEGASKNKDMEQVKEDISPAPAKDVRDNQGSSAKAASEAEATTESSLHRKRPTHPSPSVMNALRINGLSKEEGLKIRGTGPKGRLLKGDILAHVGKINKSAPADLSARINKMAKLDLSNVKAKPAARPPAPKKAAAAVPPPPPKDASISLSISLAEVSRVQEKMQRTLGTRVPLSAFISKATAAANAALPPRKLPPSADELFNDILGLPNAPRWPSAGNFAPSFAPLHKSPALEVGKSDVDIFDELLGGSAGTTATTAVVARKVASPAQGIVAGGENVITLTVPLAEEERAREFLCRLKGLLERTPGELVV